MVVNSNCALSCVRLPSRADRFKQRTAWVRISNIRGGSTLPLFKRNGASQEASGGANEGIRSLAQYATCSALRISEQ
jgi:hypothetical protein